MFKYLLAAFFLLLLSPSLIERNFSSRVFWIIWNVGQGQWSTFVTPKTCTHFDMGGERNPSARVSEVCRGKENRIMLSHWDWDHVGFTLNARKKLNSPCLEQTPLGKAAPYKMKILNFYSECSPLQPGEKIWKELTNFKASDISRKQSNDLSHVHLVYRKFLIPGDSTVAEEKFWAQSPLIEKANYLLLGHHGSRTSTSEVLLSRLPHLKLAVASARFKRYGHPHQEVVQRLKNHHIPFIKTEDWGNLWIEIPRD